MSGEDDQVGADWLGKTQRARLTRLDAEQVWREKQTTEEAYG